MRTGSAGVLRLVRRIDLGDSPAYPRSSRAAQTHDVRYQGLVGRSRVLDAVDVAGKASLAMARRPSSYVNVASRVGFRAALPPEPRARARRARRVGAGGAADASRTEGALHRAAVERSLIVDRRGKFLPTEALVERMALDEDYTAFVIRRVFGGIGNAFRHGRADSGERDQVLFAIVALAGWTTSSRFTRWMRSRASCRGISTSPSRASLLRPRSPWGR